MSGLAHEWVRAAPGVHRNWRRGLTVRRIDSRSRLWYIEGEVHVAYERLTDAKAEVESRPVTAPFRVDA